MQRTCMHAEQQAYNAVRGTFPHKSLMCYFASLSVEASCHAYRQFWVVNQFATEFRACDNSRHIETGLA